MDSMVIGLEEVEDAVDGAVMDVVSGTDWIVDGGAVRVYSY